MKIFVILVMLLGLLTVANAQVYEENVVVSRESWLGAFTWGCSSPYCSGLSNAYLKECYGTLQKYYCGDNTVCVNGKCVYNAANSCAVKEIKRECSDLLNNGNAYVVCTQEANCGTVCLNYPCKADEVCSNGECVQKASGNCYYHLVDKRCTEPGYSVNAAVVLKSYEMADCSTVTYRTVCSPGDRCVDGECVLVSTSDYCKNLGYELGDDNWECSTMMSGGKQVSRVIQFICNGMNVERKTYDCDENARCNPATVKEENGCEVIDSSFNKYVQGTGDLVGGILGEAVGSSLKGFLDKLFTNVGWIVGVILLVILFIVLLPAIVPLLTLVGKGLAVLFSSIMKFFR